MPPARRSAHRCSPWRSGASRSPGAGRRGALASARRCSRAAGRRAAVPPWSRRVHPCHGRLRTAPRDAARPWPTRPKRSTTSGHPSPLLVSSVLPWVGESNAGSRKKQRPPNLTFGRPCFFALRLRLLSSDRGGLFLELEHDLLGLGEVDGHLAAVLQLAEQQLVG